MSDPLRLLSEAGVAVWLDDLSRERLQTGNLADLIRDRSLVGVTTNQYSNNNIRSGFTATGGRCRQNRSALAWMRSPRLAVRSRPFR